MSDHLPACPWSRTSEPPWGTVDCYECTMIAVREAHRPWWQLLVEWVRHAARR